MVRIVHSILVGLVATTGLMNGVARASDPAAWFPADTLIYVGNEGLDANQAAMAGTALGRLSQTEAWKAMTGSLGNWSELLEMDEIRDELGDNEREVLGLALELQSALTKSPAAVALTKLDLSTQPPGIELSGLLQDEAMAAKVFEMAQQFDGRALEIEGYAFRRWPLDEIGSAAYLGVVDGTLVFGIGENSVLRLIARRDLGAASLAERAEYKTGLARTIADGNLIGSAFLDTARLVDLFLPIIKAEADAEMPVDVLDRIAAIVRKGPITAASSVAGDRYRNGLFIALDGAYDPASVPNVDLAQLQSIPNGSAGFWAGRIDLAALYDVIFSTIESIDSEQGKLARIRADNAVQAFYGMPANEFLGAFGSHFTFYEDPSARGIFPSLVMSLRPTSPEVLDGLCRQVVGLMNAFGAEEFEAKIHTHDANGVEVFYVQLHGQPVPFAPAWAMQNGNLICALHPTMVASVVDAKTRGEGSILNSAKFVKSRSRLDYSATSMVYLDTAQFAKLFYPLMIYGQQALFGVVETAMRKTDPEFELVGGDLPLRREVVEATVPTLSVTSRLADGYLLATESVSPNGDPVTVLGGVAAVGVVAAVMLPAVGLVRNKADMMATTKEGQRIHLFVASYLDENGAPPVSMEELSEWRHWEDMGPKLNGTWKIYDLGPNQDGVRDFAIVSDEASGGDGLRCVVRADGSANWYSDAEIERLIKGEK